MLILMLLLLLNFGISGWNAYVAGRVWREVSGFMRLVTWAALILSACGFLQVAAVICGYIALMQGWINPDGMNALLSLTYLMIIVPVLGAGLIITIHSWIEAYKRRDFASIALAGWNTLAQGYDTFDALDGGISSTFSTVADFFTPSDNDDAKTIAGKIGLLLVLLAALLIAGGLTFLFFHLGQEAAIPSPQELAVRQARQTAA
jgi:hypothetical protein